jgi:hypothetical protein
MVRSASSLPSKRASVEEKAPLRKEPMKTATNSSLAMLGATAAVRRKARRNSWSGNSPGGCEQWLLTRCLASSGVVVAQAWELSVDMMMDDVCCLCVVWEKKGA